MNASASAAADHPVPMSRSIGRSVAAIAICLLAACSSEDDTSAIVSAPTAAAPTTAATTPAVATTPSPDTTGPGTTAATAGTAASDPPADDEPAASAPTTDLDASATLIEALTATSASYGFVSIATVGDQVAVTVEGDHTAAGTQMRVVSQRAAVDYLVVDGSSWVFDDGVWQELDDEAVVEDPLAQLADPNDVVVDGIDGDLLRLVVSYPAVALGLAGDDVDVTIEIAAGRIVTLEYTTEIDGTPAAVRAELTALADPAPVITAPNA